MVKEYEKLKIFYENFKTNLSNKGFIISEVVFHDYHFIVNLSKSNGQIDDKKDNIMLKVFYKPSTDSYRLLLNEDIKLKSLLIETFIVTEEQIKQLINSKNDIYIKIFIDGSYNQKTEIVGWAYCIVKNYDLIHKEYGNLKDEFKNLRQIMGEIYALYKAIIYLKEQNIKEALIYYDYKGIEYWMNGKWKVKDKKIEDLIDQIKEILNECKIKLIFKKVEAHSGNYFNELVDKMAKEATIGRFLT